MRIPKRYGERTPHFSEVQSERRKYILAYEGHKTESQYFHGIIENRTEININPIIEILPLSRSIPQISHSHPNHVFRLIEEHLDEYDSVKVLIDKISDFLSEAAGIPFDDHKSICSLHHEVLSYFCDVLQYQTDERIEVDNELILGLLSYIENDFDINEKVEEISQYLNEQQIVYLPEHDYVCLIIDRDSGSFKREQYERLIDKCKNKNYRLFVSTPTFEFWLLLHNDEVFLHDQKELLENKRQGQKRYLEQALTQAYSGYRKERIHFERFLPDIRKAIQNEKCFCEDVNHLIDMLGTNVGVLINEMMQ